MNYPNQITGSGMGGSVCVEQPARTPEIEQVMCRLRNKVSDLHERIDILHTRISPIMISSPASADKSKGAPVYQTTLGSMLGETVESLEVIERKLCDLTSRIEL